MKIVRAIDALYALCTRVLCTGYSRGTPIGVLSVGAETRALQRRRLKRDAPSHVATARVEMLRAAVSHHIPLQRGNVARYPLEAARDPNLLQRCTSSVAT